MAQLLHGYWNCHYVPVWHESESINGFVEPMRLDSISNAPELFMNCNTRPNQPQQAIATCRKHAHLKKEKPQTGKMRESVFGQKRQAAVVGKRQPLKTFESFVPLRTKKGDAAVARKNRGDLLDWNPHAGGDDVWKRRRFGWEAGERTRFAETHACCHRDKRIRIDLTYSIMRQIQRLQSTLRASV